MPIYDTLLPRNERTTLWPIPKDYNLEPPEDDQEEDDAYDYDHYEAFSSGRNCLSLEELAKYLTSYTKRRNNNDDKESAIGENLSNRAQERKH